jgi:hypothetical protein
MRRAFFFGIMVTTIALSLLLGTSTARTPKGEPPPECALLDQPKARGLMSAMLEARLLRKCGRQDELGLDEAAGTPKTLLSPPRRLDQLPGAINDVLVNDPSGDAGAYTHTQSETSLALNQDTGTLCACYNDSFHYYEGTGGSGFSSSTDGGLTFTDHGVHPGGQGGESGGDPSVVWRRSDGLFYYAALCDAGLCLWQSLDDCSTFSQYTVIHQGWGDDKEMMAVDNNPASPYYGRVYVAWTDFDRGERIYVTHSGDLGWSPPVAVSPEDVDVQGAWPAVAPNGDVYVGWVRWESYPQGPIDIEIVHSTDGGASFSQAANPLTGAVNPRDAVATNGCYRPALNGNIRYLPSPQLAVGPDGVLHVVYSYDPDGYDTGDVVDVFYRRSTDNGATWGPEIRLNDDGTQTDQWFPTLSVGPTNNVIATWYDRRHDTTDNYLFDYYGSFSGDGGLTWGANIRISDVSSPVYIDPYLADCYHGDYDQQVQDEDHAYILWSDDRNVQDEHQDPDIWFEKHPLTCDDVDGDGYGDPAGLACPHGGRDCNDSDPGVNPGVREGPDGDLTCTDTVDNDCDGTVDLADLGCIPCVDNDTDGYGSPASGNCTYTELDCNDGDPDVNPGAPEVCDNGIDDNCDGETDTKTDFRTAAPVIVEGDTCGAGHDCAGNPSEEHVYEVTIPTEGSWIFDLCASYYDTYLLVGTAPGTSDIGEDDDGCNSFQSRLTASDLPAGTYYATVEGFTDFDCGQYFLEIYPEGTGCVTDFVITAPTGVSGDTCGAGNDCSNRSSEEHVYEVTIPTDGSWTFDLCNSSFDTYLVVGVAKPGRDDVGTDDDGCGTWGGGSLLSADLSAGTYYVLVEGYYWGWGCGDYVLSIYPTPGETEPLLAVTDNSIAPNASLLSTTFEFAGGSTVYETTAGYSAKAWVELSEDTLFLSMPDAYLKINTIDLSIPILLWEVTGRVEDFKTTHGYLLPASVDPSDGSFVSSLHGEMRFTMSASIAGQLIGEVEDYVMPMDPIPVSGTLIEVGDTDGDGLSEYEIRMQGPFSAVLEIGEIPLVGEITATVTASLDMGLVAEPLSPDPYEQDNFPDDANLLSPGVVQSRLIHPFGDVDWLEIAAVEGEAYEVKTFGLVGSEPDTVLEVYDEAGIMITSNDNYEWDPYYYYDPLSLASLVSWTAGYTGTYYVKARTYGGSYDHFDDQGGGPAFCSYEISLPCEDLDGDGYGDPGSAVCLYPETDCNDALPNVNPGAEEICGNGIDDDCDWGIDEDCGYMGIANAQASLYGHGSVAGSGVVNQLSLLVFPLGAVLVLGILRSRARHGFHSVSAHPEPSTFPSPGPG